MLKLLFNDTVKITIIMHNFMQESISVYIANYKIKVVKILRYVKFEIRP